ncbi:DUF4214 domain-containing protein [Pseudoduganella namucuonensis]|uniref:DUF4214 domain-containing protein n=1 Tax=Pseudoduganella namucuonensis TaxID=1035707 RepID=A0A1I7L0C3_9BURK|nr:DUF4214 domain-containing protein [Pseudoduganella namucuonensis]SFV03137.1 protein of unknown function [Pseudoduganella namucuonensis]
MYEESTSTVTGALQAANPTVFTTETLNTILTLATKTGTNVSIQTVTADASGNVTVAAGTEVVMIDSSDTAVTTIKPPVNAPVLIFEGKGGVIVTVDDDGAATVPSGTGVVDRVIVGSSGNDSIIIADGKNTQVTLGSGDSTVVTGHGVDTVVAGLGDSTVTGGAGDYAVVKLAGNANNFAVTTKDGHAVITNSATGVKTDITKIQYVQLDNGNALVFAKDKVEASVTALFEAAFGRTADAGGLDYWFDLARGGASLKQIADAFVTSAEFGVNNLLSNETFINNLYNNTFGRDGEAAGMAYWLGVLNSGATRADIVRSFAQVHTLNVTGETANHEATVVGNVNIVTGII